MRADLEGANGVRLRRPHRDAAVPRPGPQRQRLALDLVPSPSFIEDGKKRLRQCFDAEKCMKQWLCSSMYMNHCFCE